MKNFISKFKYFLLGGIVFVGFGVYAANLQPSFTPSLIPVEDSKYYLGSTSPARAWLGIYVNEVCLTADTCRTTWPTGGSGDFAWTVNSWGNSTSTTLGFYQGFLSNASSTIASALRLSSIGQGFLYTGSGGLVQSIASSSVQLSWFNNDVGFEVGLT